MSDALMGVYNRAPLEVDHGVGCRLFARDGRSYLDCVAGIATDGLGHAHPALVGDGDHLGRVLEVLLAAEAEHPAGKAAAIL